MKVYKWIEIKDDKKLWDDAVILPMAAKKVAIHQGHVEIINYAKQFGRVLIVLILNPNETYQPGDLRPMYQSLSPLGIEEVVLRKPNWDNDDLKNTKEEFKDLKYDFLSGDKLETYHKYLAAQRYRWGVKMKTMVMGPDIENFLTKVALKSKKYEDRLTIFPKIVKDKYWLRIRTTPLNISEEQYVILKTLPSETDRIRFKFHVGDNADVVHWGNRHYKNVKWRYKTIQVFEGEPWGGRFEYIVYEFDNPDGGTRVVDEANYVPTS